MSEILKNQIKKFLKSQKLISVATVNNENLPWIANVYFGVNDALELFFVSSKSTTHSKDIASQENVAFTSVWFEEHDLGNRKSVQGKGKCQLVTDWGEVFEGLKEIYAKFPDWKEDINIEAMKINIIESRLYKITPNYIKYWDDENLPKLKTEELFL